MFDNAYGGGHVYVLLVFFVLNVVALIQVWRDSRRSTLIKVIWTAIIVALPGVGGLGWLFNWSLGKITEKLNNRAA